MIRVRSSTAAIEEVMPALLTEMNEINASAEQVETFVMQHAIYDGDLSLVVVWQTQRKPEKTRQGLMFAERLQQIGTVDHAIWIPVKRNGVFEEE